MEWWVPVLVLGYFVPAVIASARHHRSESAIALVNLLIGWTLVGWLWALIWAFTGEPKVKPEKARQISRDNDAGRWPCPWCFGDIDPRAEVCPHCRKPTLPAR